MGRQMRRFEDRPATRERVPLLVGLFGPSGSGKTYSALRLATGIQSVVGGDIGVIDTEARRALHYADRFQFRHLEFGAPFGPLDYLAALEHFAAKGVRVVVIDSMSHEHEGPGGVLEAHESEMHRLSGGDAKKAERVKMLAWAKPKANRRRLLNGILQMGSNFVFCFRAKEKIKPVTGGQPEELGWMPIAGDEFLYEMTVNCLLPPGADGRPQWKPSRKGEQTLVKLPQQFRDLLSGGSQLDEDMGASLARWAAGDGAPGPAREEPGPTSSKGDRERLKQSLFEALSRLGLGGDTPTEKRARRLQWLRLAIGNEDVESTDELSTEELRRAVKTAESGETF